jgi:ParE toxin of type II toxin-antitoxin system, parDE
LRGAWRRGMRRDERGYMCRRKKCWRGWINACVLTQGRAAQVRYTVRFAPAAAQDLERLFEFLAQHDAKAAKRARAAIADGIEYRFWREGLRCIV